VTGIGEGGFTTPAPLPFLAHPVRARRVCASLPPQRRRVPGHGSRDAILVLVAEAPGRFGADRTGVPFSGDRSGPFLRELIAGLGLDAGRDVYLTNVVKCNPRDERGNNRSLGRRIAEPGLPSPHRLIRTVGRPGGTGKLGHAAQNDSFDCCLALSDRSWGGKLPEPRGVNPACFTGSESRLRPGRPPPAAGRAPMRRRDRPGAGRAGRSSPPGQRTRRCRKRG
jgi:hypothetical protein